MDTPRSGGARPRRLPRQGLTDLVTERLREMIFDRIIEPGDRIKIDQLARDLDVSISPVREALARLSSTGLVTQEPYVGYRAAPMPPRQYYQDLLDFREVMELEACRRGAPAATSSILNEMHHAVAEMQKGSLGHHYERYSHFHQMDARFHAVLIASAGNVLMDRVHADLDAHWHMARLFIETEDTERAARVVREHLAIVEAFEARDALAAEGAVKAHLESSRCTLGLLDDAVSDSEQKSP